MTGSPTERFGAALAALHAELDWRLLGELSCDGDGSEFFDPESRAALLDAGLRLAGDLGAALAGLDGGAGRSLYVGASVAELPVILFDSIVARRRVLWRNPAQREGAELNRALAAVAERLGIALPRVVADEGAPPGPFDHLWLVSVLTDPEHFPALHDELYERRGTPLATGRGDLGVDRRRARALVDQAVSGLVEPSVVVTSDEELPWLRAGLEARGLELCVPEAGRTSPVVGDVLRICRVRAAAQRARARRRS